MQRFKVLWSHILLVYVLLHEVVAPGPHPKCRGPLQLYDGIKGECVCKNGLYGQNCDQNSTLCRTHTCGFDDVCTKSPGAPTKPWCVGPKYQAQLLLLFQPERTVSSKYVYWLRKRLLSIYVGKSGALKPGNKSTGDVVVEVVSGLLLKPHKKLFVSFVMFHNHSTYIPAAHVCKALHTTSFACMKPSQCKLLQDSGVRCPVKTAPWKPKPVPILTGGVIALIVAVCVIVLILAVGLVLMKIRRRGYDNQRRISLTELTEEFDDY